MNKYYSTYDLGEAAALVAFGHPLEAIEKPTEDDTRTAFCFINQDNINDVVKLHWQDKLLIPSQSYFNAMKMLKSRIYS